MHTLTVAQAQFELHWDLLPTSPQNEKNTLGFQIQILSILSYCHCHPAFEPKGQFIQRFIVSYVASPLEQCTRAPPAQPAKGGCWKEVERKGRGGARIARSVARIARSATIRACSVLLLFELCQQSCDPFGCERPERSKNRIFATSSWIEKIVWDLWGLDHKGIPSRYSQPRPWAPSTCSPQRMLHQSNVSVSMSVPCIDVWDQDLIVSHYKIGSFATHMLVTHTIIACWLSTGAHSACLQWFPAES